MFETNLQEIYFHVMMIPIVSITNNIIYFQTKYYYDTNTLV